MNINSYDLNSKYKSGDRVTIMNTQNMQNLGIAGKPGFLLEKYSMDEYGNDIYNVACNGQVYKISTSEFNKKYV